MYCVPVGFMDLKSRSDARITGSISVIGGAGNDINFSIADERNYMRFKAGKAYVTFGQIDMAIAVAFDAPKTHSGNNYLLFGNSFSALPQ